MHFRAIICWIGKTTGGLLNIVLFYTLATLAKKEVERSNLIDNLWISVQQQNRNGTGSFKIK